MSETKSPAIKVDPFFKSLIRPLLTQEYQQLEANIMQDGCRDPLVTWKGVIIDGHNRYEICSRHNIPFTTTEMQFSCREEAVAWICANQLGRRNLTDETRKYLIGLQYENERIANDKKNPKGKNQFTTDINMNQTGEKTGSLRNKTAQRIADANNISHTTVEKYALYSKALKEIEKKAPELSKRILSGSYKVSHRNVLEMSKQSKRSLQRISRQLAQTRLEGSPCKTVRNEIQQAINNKQLPVPASPSVKDMPAYDPDAELIGLTLTIPSWRSSLSRLKEKTDLEATSDSAKRRFRTELNDLRLCIEEMLDAIKETT